MQNQIADTRTTITETEIDNKALINQTFTNEQKIHEAVTKGLAIVDAIPKKNGRRDWEGNSTKALEIAALWWSIQDIISKFKFASALGISPGGMEIWVRRYEQRIAPKSPATVPDKLGPPKPNKNVIPVIETKNSSGGRTIRNETELPPDGTFLHAIDGQGNLYIKKITYEKITFGSERFETIVKNIRIKEPSP